MSARHVILLVDDERSFPNHPRVADIEIHRTWQSAARRLRANSLDVEEIWFDYYLKDGYTTKILVESLFRYVDKNFKSEGVIRFVTSDVDFALKMMSKLTSEGYTVKPPE